MAGLSERPVKEFVHREFMSVALGSLEVTRHYPASGVSPGGPSHEPSYPSREPSYITVDRADPHIMVRDTFLHDVYDQLCPQLRLELPSGMEFKGPWIEYHDHSYEATPWPCQPWGNPASRCWFNWLLHVDVDQHLVYRIGTYDLELDAWRASWPD